MVDGWLGELWNRGFSYEGRYIGQSEDMPENFNLAAQEHTTKATYQL